MNRFLSSSSGRLLSLAFALALGGGALGRLVPENGMLIAAVTMITAFAMTVVALFTAIEENFGPAALAVVVLPWIAFVVEIGFGVLPPTGAWAVLAIAAGFLAFGAWPRGAAKRATGVSLHRPAGAEA
ncbi:MAG TPA: hypothetical protein VHB21_00670 [Minicystis sp.]|nr:hypothetical protein [Minicystis sp.]